MKIKDYQSALGILEPEIKRNQSMLLRLTYGDCLRLCNHLHESIDQYNIICQDTHLALVGLLKRMTAYYELAEYDLSLLDCNNLILNKVESSEVYYFKGMNLLKLNPEFPV
jgi:hypothetical protein